MAKADRSRWDARWAQRDSAPVPAIPVEFAALDALLTRARYRPQFGKSAEPGTALELACGQGQVALWLAGRGLQVQAVDVSSTAIAVATRAAGRLGLDSRCRFEVHDLDDGLPAGPAVDFGVCVNFWDPVVLAALVDRVRPGGMIALKVLSEVDAGRGRYRAPAGSLLDLVGSWRVVNSVEGQGTAAVLAERPTD